MGRALRTSATVLVFVGLVGGYLFADAHDLVPGMLTVAPPHPPPPPFPEPPGATLGPQPEPILASLPVEAAPPASSDVAALVAELVNDERLGPRLGVLVVDAITGQTLGEANSATLFVPASTQKTLTGAAALTQLDPDATLLTRAVLQGDQVILVGGGDMMLAADHGNPNLVNGRAGMADLAEQVAAELTLSGNTRVRMGLDDTLFSGPPASPAVPPIEVSRWVSNVSSVAIAQGIFEPGQRERHPDPGFAAARAFEQALVAEGITVIGQLDRVTAASDARLLGSVESATIRELSAFMMRHSDNTLTEVLGRLVAIDTGRPGSVDGSIQAVLAVVGELGVNTDGALLMDLSGLARGSQLTPRMLTDLIRLTIDPTQPQLRDLLVDMPVAGLSGTLSLPRFDGENPARGLTRAKTGTLPGVVGLAGTVITADDRLLVFSLVVDELEPGATVGAQMIFDQFVGSLAALGGEQ